MDKQRNTETIRIVVQPRFKTKVRERASKMGVNMSTYIKHLILSDVQGIPTYDASERVKKSINDSSRTKGVKTEGRRASDVLREL